MKKFRKILYIFHGQLCASLQSKRIWAAYLFGIINVLMSVKIYHLYTGERVFQVFELYIIHFMTVWDVSLMLMGFIVTISNAPFVDNRSTLMLYRVSRGQWFCGMSMYIFWQGILYYGIPLLISMLFSMKQGYLANIWSRPMYNQARFPSSEWNLPRPGEALIENYTPLSAMFFTFLLIFLYSMILAHILLIFNTVFTGAIGTVIAAAVHLCGYVLMFDGVANKWGSLSLYYHSIFSASLDKTNLLQSVIYLLLILCILLFIGSPLVRRSDFRYRAGEKNE